MNLIKSMDAWHSGGFALKNALFALDTCGAIMPGAPEDDVKMMARLYQTDHWKLRQIWCRLGLLLLMTRESEFAKSFCSLCREGLPRVRRRNARNMKADHLPGMRKRVPTCAERIGAYGCVKAVNRISPVVSVYPGPSALAPRFIIPRSCHSRECGIHFDFRGLHCIIAPTQHIKNGSPAFARMTGSGGAGLPAGQNMPLARQHSTIGSSQLSTIP